MDQSLDRFVEKMIALRNAEETKPLSWKELKQVALDVGLTEQEWANVETQFNTHTERGQSFLRYRNYDDSIQEFEQALSFYPTHTHTLFSLASAYALRWRAKGDANDKELSLKYCDATLQIEPTHDQAIKLLSELKQQVERNKKQSPKRNSTYLIVAIILILLALGAGVFSLFPVMGPTEPPPPPATENISAPIVPEVEVKKVEVPIENSFKVFKDWDVPVKFKVDSKSKHLDFSIDKSSFEDFTTSFSYDFTGYIGPKSNVDVSFLELTFQLLDKNGNVNIEGTKEVIPEHDPVHRVGDLAAIDFMEYEGNRKMPEFSEVHIFVSKIITEESAGTYNPSPIKEFKWKNGKPNNIDLELRERMNTVGSSFKETLTHEIELEFRNIGNRNIESLQFEVTWWDKSGKAYPSKELHATISSYAKIRRNQTRLYGRLWILDDITPETFSHYTVKILSAK